MGRRKGDTPQKAALRQLMQGYLKDNDISVKNGTDVIVDYLGKQYVIELKIWRGNEYNKRGEKQLAEYLEYYHLEKGYLLSFNFNKNKKIGLKEVEVDNKKIIEVVV